MTSARMPDHLRYHGVTALLPLVLRPTLVRLRNGALRGPEPVAVPAAEVAVPAPAPAAAAPALEPAPAEGPRGCAWRRSVS